MPTPSLLIVPARFKSGKLYSQIPTSGAGDFTVTRATAATRVNASGFIESVASGIPRLDYFASGGTVGCPALLVEPAATNICLQSENFLTTWGLSNGTISTGTTTAFTAPDGTTSADLFTESTDVSATNHQINQSISTAVVSGTSYTVSCFFKATAANRSARLSLSSALFSGSPQAFFDIVNGVVGQATDCTSRIENYGNGWYRCIMTAICDSSGTTNIFTGSASGNTRDYIGNGSASLYLWGAQLETGSVATSYIPTTTGSVTRNADVVSVSGAVSGSIGQTEGTIYVEVDYRNFSASSQAILHLFQNGNNLIGIQVIRSGANNQFQAYAFVAGSLVVSITSTISTAGVYKIALGYNLNDYALYINGTLIGVDSSAGVPTANQVLLGHYANLIQFNDRIRAAALYTTRLTNAQLQTLTSP